MHQAVVLVAASAAMFVQDYLGTYLVVAETRGRRWLAGTLDATSDWFKYGVGAVVSAALIQHGVMAGVVTLAVLGVTSFFATSFATARAARMPSVSVIPADPIPVGRDG